MTLRYLKKALILSVFFIASFLNFAQAAPGNCTTTNYDETVAVKYVVDGDTIVLKDNRKVRLIGINTPEMGYGDKKPEAFALQAKQYLISVLKRGEKIRLRFGKQPQDRYGRLLAHLFLMNGRNINVLLLEQGLASVIAVPPNVKMLDCYIRKEQLAQNNRKNIWANQYTQYLDASKLSLTNTGYHFVKGKIIRVGQGRDAIYLQLAKKFTVRIKRKDFIYFNALNLDELTMKNLINKRVYVRGWVYKRKKELYLEPKHEAMFKVI